MIQVLPQENNQKQIGQKMQNQASTSFKERIFQADMTRASASAAESQRLATERASSKTGVLQVAALFNLDIKKRERKGEDGLCALH